MAQDRPGRSQGAPDAAWLVVSRKAAGLPNARFLSAVLRTGPSRGGYLLISIPCRAGLARCGGVYVIEARLRSSRQRSTLRGAPLEGHCELG